MSRATQTAAREEAVDDKFVSEAWKMRQRRIGRIGMRLPWDVLFEEGQTLRLGGEDVGTVFVRRDYEPVVDRRDDGRQVTVLPGSHVYGVEMTFDRYRELATRRVVSGPLMVGEMVGLDITLQYNGESRT
jgi:hypothetical protein